MIQDIGAGRLSLAYDRLPASAAAAVLAFSDGRLACRVEGGSFRLPSAGELAAADEDLRFAFSLDGNRFYLRFADSEPALPVGFEWRDVSELRRLEPADLAFAALTGLHLHHWYRSARFCGCCGAALRPSEHERAMVCPSCANTVYPRINPAVIVGVTDGERLALTRYAGRPYKGRALVAGFIEVGEAPEDCVRREVLEELGLSVTNIRYAGSQPWGMADDLLLGFFCDVEGSAEIRLDGEELESAEWAARTDIEEPPNTRTLTNHMIELFRQGREPR